MKVQQSSEAWSTAVGVTAGENESWLLLNC